MKKGVNWIGVSSVLVALFLAGGCSTIKRITSSNTDSPKSLTILFDKPAPEMTDDNAMRGTDILVEIGKAHSSCGLDAISFQRHLEKIQQISSEDHDFNALCNIYVTAARICHDAKVKPKKYVIETTTNTETSRNTDLSPNLSVKLVDLGMDAGIEKKKVGTGAKATGAEMALSVPIHFSKTQITHMNLVESVEYAPEILIAPSDLRILQTLEDTAYTYVVGTLSQAGFSRYSHGDFVGVWSWKWIEDGVSQGIIIFTLKDDMRMEAKLMPSGNNLVYKASNWGDGDWSYENGLLTITMHRVGNTRVPLLAVDNEVTWIDNPIEYISDNGDKILLQNGETLTKTK